MQEIIGNIESLIQHSLKEKVGEILPLPLSGSDRRYFRVSTSCGTYIATYNTNTKENDTFIHFSNHFIEKGLPVPKVLCINESRTIYVQQDLGNTTLLNVLETEGPTDAVKNLFKESLHQLARLQVLGDEGMNYDWCLTAKEFGKQAILSDLLYFKYYFLDTLKMPYDKQAMLDNFDALATYLTHTEYKFFMFRDFQSRNVMIKNGQPYFIDFQGGMKGAPQYDAASMIWQAKADLSKEWKKELLEFYIDSLENILEKKINRLAFTGQYYGYVLIRLLQVLGAYGFRGMFERKAHFLTSIPLALKNLKWFMQNRDIGIAVPEFEKMLHFIVSDEIIEKFTPQQATDQTPLIVYVNSFSYKATGYPPEESDHGGGFVFDCRGILNPGRVDQFKAQNGKDKEVIDFLENYTQMPDFLNNVFNIIDISIENYMKRGFERLTINFGCTGGQHRSVYAAEQTARHLRNKYKVKVVLSHLNKDGWIRSI